MDASRAENPRQRQCLLRHELGRQLRLCAEEAGFLQGGEDQARLQLHPAQDEAERPEDRQRHLLASAPLPPLTDGALGAGCSEPGCGWSPCRRHGEERASPAPRARALWQPVASASLCTSSRFNQVFFFFFSTQDGSGGNLSVLLFLFLTPSTVRHSSSRRPAQSRSPPLCRRCLVSARAGERRPAEGPFARSGGRDAATGASRRWFLPPRPYPGRSRGRGGTLEGMQPRAGAGSPEKGCVRAAMERAPRALDDWKPSRGLAPLPDPAGLRQPNLHQRSNASVSSAGRGSFARLPVPPELPA